MAPGSKLLPALDDTKIHVKLKLFSLWCSVMFFYIYGDFFSLYKPGALQDIIAGKMSLASISQAVLLGMAASMVVPSLMPFLSLALPARVNRWANIVFGALYSLIMVVSIRGNWRFYILYALIEIALTVLIVWYAWTWPNRPAGSGALETVDPS
ncbi:MAG: DUF6326 family protein [Candidatus Acidiferrales bacterium]